jgi:D-cysteine desulfhydrase
MPPSKLSLAHLPTPLFRCDALDELVGTRLWVKRDDMTGGAEAGNKIRKLEYLLAAALEQGADTVITCGGFQSNHARATALLARRIGLRPVLLLRTLATPPPPASTGNALIDALAGAELRAISPEQYRDRNALMAEVARELAAEGARPYVIPEGGSNGLGSLGYVDAMAELSEQLSRGDQGAPPRLDAVVHACGSGGTAAGVALGAAHYGVARSVIAMAVCDDTAYFEGVTTRLIAEARALVPSLPDAPALRIVDAYKGPAYSVATPEQLRFIGAVARASGLVLDPVYTGKALFGLSQLPDKPSTALFLHTGGLPGLFAQGDALLAAQPNATVSDRW